MPAMQRRGWTHLFCRIMQVFDRRPKAAATGLHPPEYGWLLLPVICALLVFPLARVALAAIAFVWVAALLYLRKRHIGYLRAWLMASLLMGLWLGLCALLTHLAQGLFEWAGEHFADEGLMVTGVLMTSFAVYGVTAAIAIKLLRIGGWRDAGVLFLAFMCMATGAVLSGTLDSLWTFPAGTAAGALLLALRLRHYTV